MAFSPFPVRPWPIDPVPTYPAQIVYRQGHEIARARSSAATVFQLFLNAQLAALEALDAAQCNCPRRWKCQIGKLADSAGAVVKFMQAAHLERRAPYPWKPASLNQVIVATQEGAKIANGLMSTAPITTTALYKVYSLAAGIYAWTQGRDYISTAKPAPWWPRPRLRPVDCLTGAGGCGYEFVPWL